MEKNLEEEYKKTFTELSYKYDLKHNNNEETLIVW